MTISQVRRLSPVDPIDDLTALLHRAFAGLARLGWCCRSAEQTAQVTRQRVALGECLVATVDGRIVGTLTLQCTERRSPAAWYRRPRVASVHQFAVEPAWQGTGIGQALLREAERWARAQGCSELALDTPQGATGLVAYYGRRGFRPVECLRFDGRGYMSVVLSKPVAPREDRAQKAESCLARHPAEWALIRAGGSRPGQSAAHGGLSGR